MPLPSAEMMSQVVAYHGPDVLARLTNTPVEELSQETVAPSNHSQHRGKRRRTALDDKASDFFVEHVDQFVVEQSSQPPESLPDEYRFIPSVAEYLRGELASTARRLSVDGQSKRLRPGDLVKGRIVGKPVSGLLIQLNVIVAVTEQGFCEVPIAREHFKLRACCQPAEVSSDQLTDAEIETRIQLYSEGDYVIGFVLSVDTAHQRVLVSFNRNRLMPGQRHIRLGSCRPGVMAELVPHPTYSDLLQQHDVFRNPTSILELKDYFDLAPRGSFLPAFANLQIPAGERASELRRAQDRTLAGQLVGDGVKHQKVGRIKEALRCYDRALHASPDFPDALVARGALFTTTTDFPRAIKDLRRAAEVAPEHKNAMNYLETTYLRAGMHAEQENKMDAALDHYSYGANLKGVKREELLRRLATVKAVMERRASLNAVAQQSARAAFGSSMSYPTTKSGDLDEEHMSEADRIALAKVREILKAKKKAKEKKKKRKHKHRSRDSDSDSDSDERRSGRHKKKKKHKSSH